MVCLGDVITIRAEVDSYEPLSLKGGARMKDMNRFICAVEGDMSEEEAEVAEKIHDAMVALDEAWEAYANETDNYRKLKEKFITITRHAFK